MSTREFKKLKRLATNAHAIQQDFSPSLDELIGHIPKTERAYLPGDMEDAYGSEFDNVGPPKGLHLIKLPHTLLNSAGLGLHGGPDALLYIRPRCLTQIVFMCHDVMEHGFVGHIFGQPGTGKSSTALFVATRFAKDKGCSVLWAHLSVGIPDNAWDCIHMEPDGSLSSFAGLTDPEMTDLLKRFGGADNESSKYYVVILDGIKLDGHCSKIPARSWVSANRSRRRLILISSEGGDKGLSGRQRTENEIRIFRQWSWDYRSYKDASSIPEFWSHIESVLDSPEAPDLPENLSEIEQRLWNKYYFSGGCARWMFKYSTKQVQADIDGAISKGLKSGDIDPNVISRLFSRFKPNQVQIVSEYARQMMLESMGTVALKALQRHPMITQCDNGAQGQLFHLFVYFEALERSARREGIILRNRRGSDMAMVFESVVRKHVPGLTRSDCPLRTLIWPYNAYQPAFDGFYIDNQGYGDVIVFIQVTIGERHKVDLIKLRQTMEQLQLNKCEFHFIIPMHMMAQFKVGPIINPQALSKYNWPVDEQSIIAQIKVFGIDGWGRI